MLHTAEACHPGSPSYGLWSACPIDVLVRCFKAQQDYTDNSAAACVCRPWRDTFRTSAEHISIQQNFLNEGLLSPTYLQQFKGIHTVEVARGLDWQHRQPSSWLTAVEHPQQQPESSTADVHRWYQTMQSVPASCCLLKIVDSLPAQTLNPVSQLTNLQRLQLQSCWGPRVSLKALGVLPKLLSLRLIGQTSSIQVYGSLGDLPARITGLQLSCCTAMDYSPGIGFGLQDLRRLPKLAVLNISLCRVNFGTEAEQVDLSHIRVLLLERAQAPCPPSVVASLTTATHLQELSLRMFLLDDRRFALSLELLLSLPSLRRLDVTSCMHVRVGLSESNQLRLHAFAFHFHQLTTLEGCHFNHLIQLIQTGHDNTMKPVLQVEGRLPRSGHQHWLQTLPMLALTHLTISEAHAWPLPLFLDSRSEALPHLLYFDVSIASAVTLNPTKITFPEGCSLQEIYLSGISCASVDFAACTALTSLGIIHRGHQFPALDLPTSLERLYLHNALKADADPQLHRLTNLLYLKLGGRAVSKGIMKYLPELPPSLHELDLWDGVVKQLDQLSLLTKLKKLRLPSPPTSQQLAIIKKMRHLKHIDVTTLTGADIPGLPCLPVGCGSTHACLTRCLSLFYLFFR